MRPRHGLRWRLIVLALFIALAASYVWYARSETFLHGGSPMGLTYGVIALFLMLLLLSFGIRKRSYRSRFGTMEGWLQSHIWLGIFSLAVILAHTGFRFQDRVAVALMLVIAGIVISGIVGAVLYKTVPRALTEVESNLTIPEISEQINQLSRSMARIASGHSATFQRVYESLIRDIRPRSLGGWRLLLGGGRSLRADEKTGDWAKQLSLVGRDEQPDLRQLLVLSRQQKELHFRLLAQQRYRNILDFWLYVHIPLSIAMIVLLVAHVVGALYYGRILR